MLRIVFFIVLLPLGLVASSKENLISTSEVYPRIVVSNVAIFDGVNEKIQEHKDIFITDGIIDTIVEFGILDYDGRHVIDGKGKTAMPGLIDAHVHIQSNGSVPWAKVKYKPQPVLDASLYCGITTIFDLGGFASKSAKLEQKRARGKIVAPVIYNTHAPITIPGAHPIPASKEALPFPFNKMVDKLMPTVSSMEEAKSVIDKYVKQDIDYVKVICDQLPPGTPEMNKETLKWIVDEIHLQGFKAVVHIGSAENAINAGADILAHGILRGSLTDAEAKKIADSKIPIIYTLYAFEFTEQLGRGAYVPNQIDSVLVPQKLLSGISGEEGKQVENSHVVHSFASSLTNEKDKWKENLQLLLKYNANIIVGTDAGAPGYYHGTAILHELDELKKYGLSNYQILTGATSRAALAYFSNPDFGSITQGNRADLLLLSSNPLEELSVVKFPEMIVTNGRIVKRNK